MPHQPACIRSSASVNASNVNAKQCSAFQRHNPTAPVVCLSSRAGKNPTEKDLSKGHWCFPERSTQLGWICFSKDLCASDVCHCFLYSAGMIDHDVIVGINGLPIHSMQEVSEAIQSSTVLSVVVRRKDQDVLLTIIPEDTDWYHWL